MTDNVMELFPMTSSEIERWLSERADYVTGWERVQDIEDMNIPMMAGIFYETIREGRVPRLREFTLEYINRHHDLWDSLDSIQQDGLLGRLVRTYPSLLRDIHMGTMLRENGYHVTYNEELDTKYGIDLLIEKNGKRLGLKLSVNTKNANTYSRIKNTRGYKEIDFPAVKLKINLGGGRCISGYYLYNEEHVAKIGKLFDEIGKEIVCTL